MIVGFATGFEIVVLLSPVEGDQANVPLPVPFKVVFEPKQMETSGPALATGELIYAMVVLSSSARQEPFPVEVRIKITEPVVVSAGLEL